MQLKTALVVFLLSLAPVPAFAQSTSAPLHVTATVIRSCRVDVPPSAQPSQLPTLAVVLTCVKSSGAAARVQRPAPRREPRGDVVVINF